MTAAPRRRRVSPLLLVVLALVAAAWLGFEVADARLAASIHLPDDPASFPFVWEPLMRRRHTISRALPGLPPRSVIFTTNGLGLRGDELDTSVEGGPLRVLTLGGSVTEGILLADDEGWPRLLQDELEARTGADVWVGNAGKSGQMALDYVVHARVLVPAIEPSVVVVLPGANDLQSAIEDRYFPVDLSVPANLEQFAAALYPEAHRTAAEGFAASPAAFMIRRRLRTREIDGTRDYEFKRQRRFDATHEETFLDLPLLLALYEANLRELVATLRAGGVEHVVLLTHPFQWSEEMSDEQRRSLLSGYGCEWCPEPLYYSVAVLERSLRAVNEVTLAVCADSSAVCVDLEPRVPKTLEYFYDDHHVLPAGARLIAGVVAEGMVEQGVVP